MTDAEKWERREVIANNKAWDSAVTVRRRWTTQFLTRKNPPKDAAGFIASSLAWGCHDVRRAMEFGNRGACALLGLPEPPGYNSSQPNPLIAAAASATGPRAVQVSLAVLLGGFEEGTSRNSWRDPTRATRAYFEQLRAWGYPLSAVEQRVLSGDSGDSGEGDTEAGVEPAGETSEPAPVNDEPDHAEPSGADHSTSESSTTKPSAE
jgi:ParB family chromosome partitioning protein